MSADPDSRGTAIDEQRRLSADTLAEVNENILRSVRDSDDGGLEWEFFCECGKESCHDHVFLTLDGYIELREHVGVVLADGHRRSQVERARGLREDAEALRRQAQHQLKRALRNLGSRTCL